MEIYDLELWLRFARLKGGFVCSHIEVALLATGLALADQMAVEGEEWMQKGI